jgi:uncharacterized membrane protein
VMLLESKRRDRICVMLGAFAIILFLVLRVADGYGDPRHWKAAAQMSVVLRFLNPAKYPASLEFLLMTLGPMFLLLPLAERARGVVAGVAETFGRVPMFYYLIHIPAIHLVALIVSSIRLGHVSAWLFANHPMMNPPAPDGYMWPLPLLYAVFAVVIALLYRPSRWYARRKAANPAPWMRYI